MLNFVKCFFCICWDTRGFLLSLMWCNVVDFVYTEPSLWIGDESHLVMVCDLFYVLLGFGLLIFCWEVLHLYSLKILACNFLFWWCLCLVLVQGDGGLIECLWECSSTSVFWKSLRRTGISSLYDWWTSPVKSSGPGLWFVGSFFLWLQIPFHF